MRKLFFAIIAIVLLSACKNSGEYLKVTHDPILYCKTVKKLNDIVLENNFPPMIAARNYVYANIAAYECIVAGDSSYQTLSGQIKHMPAMPSPDPGKKIDFHLAAMLAFTKVGNEVTFPEGSMMAYYDDLVEKADDAGMPADVLDNTKEYSDKVFAAIMD